MSLFKKTNPRRSHLRKNLAADRINRYSRYLDTDLIASGMLWMLTVCLTALVLGFDLLLRGCFRTFGGLALINLLIYVGIAFYVFHYQSRLIRNHARAMILGGISLILLLLAKIGGLSGHSGPFGTAWVTGTAVLLSIIVAITYDRRFALDAGLAYGILVCLGLSTQDYAWPQLDGLGLYMTLASGVMVCSFSLKEIRKRIKLLQVGTAAGAVVFISALSVGMLTCEMYPLPIMVLVKNAGWHALAALVMGPLVNELLPLIEQSFRIAVSMTLLDYSDANQPLLKKLAMEAPGTFSHSLMIGTIAEAGAEAIGANGLLSRVGAYYHDIGKINKPKYFTENEMGDESKHADLSPTMSQLIIIGHVKDGIEMAKEYKLPAVIRQFIESHHGTTLVATFYHAAKKRYEEAETSGNKPKDAHPPRESEFRYAGPKPRSKEAAILMIADAVEGAIRSLEEVTPSKVQTVIHNIVMKRLQDGQFDECDITIRELSLVQAAMVKTIAAHYHGRIAYPTAPDEPQTTGKSDKKNSE